MAGLYLLDAQGQLRVFERHGATPEVLAADIRQLL
jgi:cytochrome oxidase Cu insertion factor (SCO1/SenC/PrrC family)